MKLKPKTSNGVATKQDILELEERLTKRMDGLTKRMDGFVTKDEFKNEIKKLATKEEINKLPTRKDLEKYATKKDLEKYATKKDLEKYATKKDLKKLGKELRTEIAASALKLGLEIDDKHQAVLDAIQKSQNSILGAVAEFAARSENNKNEIDILTGKVYDNHEPRIQKLEEKVLQGKKITL